MAHNSDCMRRFFAPDKEKCEAFLQAQKNVVEQNRTKGANPTAVLRNPSRPNRAVSSYSPVMRSYAVLHYFCQYNNIHLIYFRSLLHIPFPYILILYIFFPRSIIFSKMPENIH